VNPTEVALFCLLSWVVGSLWGAYRYERLWKDRSLREIAADLRQQ
jgi:hypothetical protein